MRALARREHEVPRRGLEPLPSDLEGDARFQDVEDLVLSLMDVQRGLPAAVPHHSHAPSAPAQFESEAVLEASLGDLTTKERLLEVLREARAQAEEGLAEGRVIPESLLARDALRSAEQPGRLHVVAVMYEFVLSYFETMARWARWAEEEVALWPDTSRSDDLRRTVGVFRRALTRAAQLLPEARD
ncbi:hypothetical protein [Thermoleophilum album]|nr:hypothetical protein [Thermoleophilum album]